METLEIRANEHADEYYDKESERQSSMPEYILWENRKSNFIDGANWQKEQDKAIIEELLRIVKTVKFWFDNEANYPEGTGGHKIAKKANEAITKAENHLK